MKEETLNPGFLLTKALKYWYFFAILLPLCLGIAYLYLKNSPRIYQSEASVLIKDEEGSGQLSAAQLFEDLGLASNSKKLENEIAILTSTPIVRKVVKERKLNYEYIIETPLRNIHLYNNAPFEVQAWEPGKADSAFVGSISQRTGGQFLLEYETLNGGMVKKTGIFGMPLLLEDLGKLTLRRTTYPFDDNSILLRISTEIDFSKMIQGNLTVAALSEESSVLTLNLTDIIPARARDVLQGIIKDYNENSIHLENRVFRNTLDLINDRIVMINGELSSAEKELEYYKRSNGTVELSTEGEMLLTNLTQYNDEIKEIEVRMAILQSIEDFLVSQKSSFEFVPTNLELNNLTLTSQLTTFNELLSQRQSQENDLGPNHPDLALVSSQISNLRENIIQSIASIKTDLEIGRQASSREKDRIEARLQTLPTRERELIQRERNKGVMENLYLYLLQKREETAISMAVTTSVGQVIEPPTLPTNPISPKPMQIWVISLFFGLALPSGLLLLMLNLNDKIYSAEELAHYSSIPILGTLANGDPDNSLAFREGELTVTAEMFRMLRANLSYIQPETVIKSILITSAVPGEGKSYTALNLALSQSLAGKKVLLLNLDLRKHFLRDKMGNKAKPGAAAPGIVDFLINPTLRADQVIMSSKLNNNLDVVEPGNNAPNPGELVLAPRLREFIDKVRSMYDFIVIDTPPVSLVADAMQIKDIADATLFMARIEHTSIKNIHFINSLVANKIFPRPYFVLNGVTMGKHLYKGHYKAYKLQRRGTSSKIHN